MCSKHSLVSSSSVRKGCKKNYQCVAGEETEALRCYGVFLRSHSNQYRARGKSWFLALCINSGVNNFSCVHLWCVDSLLLSVMTPNHCSSVSWPCSAKWAFRNSAQPNGWVQPWMSSGRGLRGKTLPQAMQKTWSFHLCVACTDGISVPLLWIAREVNHMLRSAWS